MITILTFILVLGFLVFIHELGHYFAARQVGVKVETFSIGFPPTILSKKIGDTEYKFSLFPIGGYVRLFGQNLNDEDNQNPQNYASKSHLQKIFILLGGPAMNLLFAIICMPIFFMLGSQMPAYLYEKPIIKEVIYDSIADVTGFESNDIIYKVNGKKVENWNDINDILSESVNILEKIKFTVDRQGNLNELFLKSNLLKNQNQIGWNPIIKPYVGGFTKNSPAKKAGLKKGDLIRSINGHVISDWIDVIPIIQKSQISVQNNESDSILVEYERGGEIKYVKLNPTFDSKSNIWLMGMSMLTLKKENNFSDSVVLGFSRVWNLTKATFEFLFKLLIGKGSFDDLGGPIRIGMVLGDAVKSGFSNLLFLMIFISLQLGIFNLLPIPALDGGHILMIGLEKLKGERLSNVFKERFQIFGFVILFSLMLIVIWNDLVQLI